MKQIIKTFHDLDAWKRGHELVLAIYHETKTFPIRESFGITDQLRRAARSVTTNIAEGFGRRTGRGKIHFFSIALGSLREVQNHLIDARDIGYLGQRQYIELQTQASIVGRVTMGLFKSAIKLPDYTPDTRAKYDLRNTNETPLNPADVK